MRFLSWNCRGLGNIEAVRALRKLIHSEAPDLVFLMETKLYNSEMLTHRGMSGLGNIFPVQCAGRGRSERGDYPSAVMQVLAVYGFPETQDKVRTWALIRRYKPDSNTPWLCIGDFNDILSPADKLGGDPPNFDQLQVATQACTDCGLSRVDGRGNSFTWTNNRTQPATIEERLDYALVNEAWQELWQVSSVFHLIRHQSDHSPIVLQCGRRRQDFRRQRVNLFRFEEVWLQSGDDCAEIVTEAWGDTELTLTDRIAGLGQALDTWGKAKYGDLPKRIAETRALLQRLQRSPHTDQIHLAIGDAEKELDELLKQEEIRWGQRSRANWLKHGDRNTSFFHKKASQWKKRNCIEEIVDDRGTKYAREVDIARVLTDYFEDLFTSSNPTGIEEVASLVGNRVTDAHRSVLLDPFTKEDIEEALFQMHPIKASGIDGFPALFYQKFWHIVGDEVAAFCLQVLNGTLSPAMINQTLLVLIPKVKKSVHANQFRPISLCNVLFKLITKVLANRMKLILPDLISEAQSAFVPGRLITDNALIAYECFHYMKKRVTGKRGMMALKLDMSKAYDRVEWPFLRAVLAHMGFPASWVTLIMNCIMTVRFSIMLNGNPQPYFAPKRGLRQGDPLSPYLFILCGEAFSALIQRSIAASTLHGIKIARGAPIISHLLFADDSILFARASLEEAECVQNILATYERASGQMINFDKSMLSVSRNVLENCFQDLQQMLGVKAVESYDRYLGLPTIIGRSKTQVFRFIKDRVWKKLKGWKEKTLSRAGREVLIKAVAQAIPSYVMSCFILPDSLCQEIEGMIARFFWGGDASKKGLHWLNWGKLCRPKLEGGLGFRGFKSFNLALVAKNWWRIYSNPESILARTYKAVYYPATSLMQARKGYRPSYAWSSIQKTSWMFDEGCCWRVGDGKNVRIWEDNWLPTGPPLSYRQDVAAEHNLRLVADLLLPSGRGWNKALIEWTFCPATAERIISVPLPLHQMEDALFWAAAQDGIYCAKSGYQFLQEKVSRSSPSSSSAPTLSEAQWCLFWKSPALPRCKQLAWRVWVGAVPVRHSLRRRGLDIDPCCAICGVEEETLDHLFLRCEVVRATWFGTELGVRIDDGVSFHAFMGQVLQTRDKEVVAAVQTVLCAIWEARNKVVFEGYEFRWRNVVSRFQSLVCPFDPGAGTTRDAGDRRAHTTRWRRPPRGRVKMNIDAATNQSKIAGFGCVARDYNGDILAAASLFPTVVLSATLGEALSLRWAMVLATQLGFRRVQFETDSLLLHQAWKKRRGSSILFTVIADCFNLMHLFDYVDLSFVRREGNSAADFMARNASSLSNVVWVEEGPPGLTAILNSDVLAFVPS
ncbi:uncharacterized protein LOC130716023 [Lotus japonicus]|uniref:uncharacterized protein LOC130716023 n=1 Tax=Lotus japonicus TaxID=34305 RepID=UPI00258DAB9D|nr:uncharacterized protein LOC130716023 [Lotus japonicus]